MTHDAARALIEAVATGDDVPVEKVNALIDAVLGGSAVRLALEARSAPTIKRLVLALRLAETVVDAFEAWEVRRAL